MNLKGASDGNVKWNELIYGQNLKLGISFAVEAPGFPQSFNNSLDELPSRQK